jgi:hypothetical protein
MDREMKDDLVRLEREIAAYASAVEKRLEWSEKENRHNASMRSLIQLLISRAMEVGETLPAVAAQQAGRFGIPFPDKISPVKVTIGTPEPRPELNSEMDVQRDEELPRDNKTDLVRQLVLRKAASGITPAEIKKIVAALKIDEGSNFPYTILSKLKAKREIREAGGRYFPEW